MSITRRLVAASPSLRRVPTAGQYRLFLDFKAADVVRTAEFTVRAARRS